MSYLVHPLSENQYLKLEKSIRRIIVKRISPKSGTLAEMKKITDDVQTDVVNISNKKIKNFVAVR